MTVRALAYTYMVRMLVFLWEKVKSEYRVVIVLAVCGDIGCEQVRRCRLCTVCKWKRIGQQHKTYTLTCKRCAACLHPENVGYLFFFYAVLRVHSLLFIRSLLFLTSLNHAWACVCLCSFLSCSRAARSYSLFLLLWYSRLSLTVCFAVFVCASLSLDFHHTVYTTLRLHVGFIVLVRPVLWIFVWERLTCMLCDRLSISWKHESNEYGNAAIFFRRQIFVCISIWFIFLAALQKRTTTSHWI